MMLSPLKVYKNEIIIGLSLLLLVVAVLYKQSAVNSGLDSKTSHTLSELKEVISLKRVWGDKKTTQKIEKLQTLVDSSKVQWSKKSTKLTATFTSLSNKELNTLISKIMNLPVQIQQLEIKKLNESYKVEFRCKW